MGFLLVIVALGMIIAVHEYGHFLFARMFGVGVDKFSVGFGPVILSKKFGETEYVLSAIPLGGFVKMVGEFNNAQESKDPRSYNSKSRWQRIVILLAGPGFNFIFGLLLVFLSFSFFGIRTPSGIVATKDVRITVAASVNYSVAMTKAIASGLSEMVTGQVKISESVGGPISIVKIGSEVKENSGWAGLLLFAAFINFNLGLLNLLPIPVLDGGSITILLIESVMRRSLSQQVRNIAVYAGLAILLSLMLFAILNDLARLLIK